MCALALLVGAASTVLYDINSTIGQLYCQNPLNNSVLVAVRTLGTDIGGTSGTAYAALTVGSAGYICTINLTTGATARPTQAAPSDGSGPGILAN